MAKICQYFFGNLLTYGAYYVIMYIKIGEVRKVDNMMAKMDEGLNETNAYRREVESLVSSGYVDYEGQPVKCRYCGSENLKDCNEEIGRYDIPEGCLCAYDVCCEECGEVVAHCAYGKWSY